MRDISRRSAAVFAVCWTGLVFCPMLAAQEPPPAQAPPQQPAQKPMPPSGGRLKRPPIRFALPRRVYVCEGGAEVVTLLETDTLRLTLNGQLYRLARVDSPNGTKFTAGTVVWSINGELAVLEDDADAANPKILAKGCRLQSAFPPNAATPSVITGTVSFGKRPAPPESAILLVELRDQNGSANDAAATLAEVEIPLKGRSSPVTFELKFDRAQLPAGARAALLASISSGTKQLFQLKEPFAVPDPTNPPPIALALSPAGRAKPPSPPPAKPQNSPQS